MSFTPTTAQLECIAELGHAKASTARIAAAVGIPEAEFVAWCQRLAAARAFGFPVVAEKRAAAAKLTEPLTEASTEVDRLFGKP